MPPIMMAYLCLCLFDGDLIVNMNSLTTDLRNQNPIRDPIFMLIVYFN